MQPPGSSVTGEQKKCWHMLGKSLTGFKLDAAYTNIMQYSPTWLTNERNMLFPQHVVPNMLAQHAVPNMLAQHVAFVCTGLKTTLTVQFVCRTNLCSQ